MDISNTHSLHIAFVSNTVGEHTQKSQFFGKYRAGSNYSLKTTSYMINQNVSDYLVKSIQQSVTNCVMSTKICCFLRSKRRGGSTFETSAP